MAWLRGLSPYSLFRFGAVATGVAVVVLMVVVFAGQSGPERVGVDRVAQSAPTPTPSLAPTPSPSPSPRPVRLPRVPPPTPMPLLPGTASPVVSYVTDTRAGISYPRFGEPWVTAAGRAFTQAQRVGPVSLPRTMVGSRPLPVAVPDEPLNTYTQYRRLATSAVRWTLRLHPPATRVVWTGSQRLPTGFGWVLSYRVSYVVNGERGHSNAVVAVVSTQASGRAKPALLFATVPHTHKELYRDLNTLVTGVRPL